MTRLVQSCGAAFVAVLWAALLLPFLSSCTHAEQDERERVIALNDKAASFYYSQLDSVRRYADSAYQISAHFPAGRAEALNHRAFASYLRMNYSYTENLAQRSISESNSLIELLFSKVLMMRVCGATSQSLKFYTLYNEVTRLMNAIDQETDDLDEHELKRYVMGRYYFYQAVIENLQNMGQTERCDSLLDEWEQLAFEMRDTVLWLNSQLTHTHDNEMIHRAVTICREQNQPYLEAQYLLRLSHTGQLHDSTYSVLLLPEQAGHIFRHFGAVREVAVAQMATAENYLELNRPQTALFYLKGALDILNSHHASYAPDDSLWLQTFSQQLDSATELRWWNRNPNRIPLPTMASAREMLSVCYAALREKQKSDYNRNAYLDILDVTRQDKQTEGLFLDLRAESHVVNTLLVSVVFLFVLSLFFVAHLNRKSRLKAYARQRKYVSTLQFCRRFVRGDEPDVDGNTPVMEGVVSSYLDWRKQNENVFRALDDKREELEEQLMMYEQRIEENKRRNVEQRAKVGVVLTMLPYIGRIVHEARRLKNGNMQREQLDYICQLTDRIEEYNTMLSQWIQMNQGELSLQVESFTIQSLFDIVRKSRQSFALKGVELKVDDTPAVVKADRSLTLFMINTLAENARKFTPNGGHVHVFACEADDYVEISVQDDGVGLSAEEVNTLCNQKFYDAKEIGRGHKEKGFGFGLMNCKGIIEKYKKTNAFFRLCSFGVQSELGHGSRFFFRLPKGVLHVLVVVMLWCVAACQNSPRVVRQRDYDIYQMDGMTDTLLRQALYWSDSCYEANLDGRYSRVRRYADSAFFYFNRHCELTDTSQVPPLCVYQRGAAEPTELQWLHHGVTTDYVSLLFLRNEIAVASLALNNRSVYRYNNEAYQCMYQMLAQDRSLPFDCERLLKANNNKAVGIILLVLLFLVLLLVYGFVVMRARWMNRFAQMQMLEINKTAVQIVSDCQREHDMDHVPQRLLNGLCRTIAELHPINALALSVNGVITVVNALHEGEPIPFRSKVEKCLHNCVEQQLKMVGDEVRCYPLEVLSDGNRTCIGAMAFVLPYADEVRTDDMMDEMIARFIALLLNSTLVRETMEHEDIEMVNDHNARAQFEENRLHIQNLVLDNCLSSLKHETMYYPSRIQQMVRQLDASLLAGEALPASKLDDLIELSDYYQQVFTLLSSQAERQLGSVCLKASQVDVDGLLRYVSKCWDKRIRRLGVEGKFTFHAEAGLRVYGDGVWLEMLFEHLIQAFLDEGVRNCQLQASGQDGFVRFDVYCPDGRLTESELNELFYPAQRHFHYWMVRQIIRDHDSQAGHCGCRINAVPCTQGGYTIWFTLPRRTVVEHRA